MTTPLGKRLRETQIAPQAQLALRAPPLPSAPVVPAALRPGWGRRVSEARPAWIKQLPAVHALAPLGRMRLARLYRIIPTHPDSARLDVAFAEWGIRSGLFGDSTTDDLLDIRMGHLAYWLAPQTSLPVLWPMGTFILWMIAVDDRYVETGSPLIELKRACNDVIHSGQSVLPPAPASRYFAELRRDVFALGGGDLMPQIADDVQTLFLWNEREQRYIKDDNLPSLSEYLKMRAANGAVNGPLQVQRCERGLLPPHRYYCERLLWIADLGTALAALNNDILGYQRDIETNYPINIIAVVSLEFRVDLATAYLMSLDLIELLRHAFDALVEDVCAYPGPYPEAAAQARAMSLWPDGYNTWHQSSPRYKVAEAIAAEGIPPEQDLRSGPLLRALASQGYLDAIPQASGDAQSLWQRLTAILFGWPAMSKPGGGLIAVPAGDSASGVCPPQGPAADAAPCAETATDASAQPGESAVHAVPPAPEAPAPGPASPPDFPSSIPVRWEPYRNFAGTITLDGVWVCEPRDTAEIVLLANWARAHGFRLRASGSAHTFTPLTVTHRARASQVLLVDTRRHLTALQMVSSEPAAVQAGAGVTIEALLTFLEQHGYGLATSPGTGDFTIGGVLATGSHGTSVDVPGRLTPFGHNNGSLSNLVTAFTAVVWDEVRNEYVARTFDRAHPDSAALLVHLGRSLLTDVTLRVGANQVLRCVSDVSQLATDVFGPAELSSAQSFASMVKRTGRVDVLWFPYHDRTWIKTWTPMSGPSGARPTAVPYNYPFVDHVPEPISDLVKQIVSGSPELGPRLSELQYDNVVQGLAATLSADLVGLSKNLMLYVRSSTLRYMTSGYAICTRHADLQRVVHEFASFYRQLVQKYQAQGLYPINGPLEIRASSLDHVAGLDVAGARPPALSAIAPYAEQPDWDVAIWLGLTTFPGTPHAYPFYREIEEFLFHQFRPPYALARAEWSKGWAYTDEGPCSDANVLSRTIPGTFGSAWEWAKSRLAAFDPHRVFSNDFLDRFL